jgi:CubicO group peptidase (beta-lactamase class C family)
VCAVALGCGGGARPSTTAASTQAEEPERKEAARPRDERHLDKRVSVDNVRARLSPFIDSIGAGFGPGFRATGFVTLSAGGDVIYERAFGHADAKADEENGADTSFRIGAISSQFTAAAVLRLVQAGKLSLEDTIGKYIPDYPAAGAAITVHQLLSHTSGLPNYLTVPALGERRTQKLAPEELLSLFWGEPLEFEPGSDFGYSDSDYVVLGIIIEKVTGKSYAEHMREELFEPFDLDDTRVGSRGSASDVARGYKASASGQLDPVQGFDDSILYAAAGVRSTAEDLLAWHDALQEGRVFDEKHEALSLRIVKNHYAYGWFVREQHGVEVVSHPGALEGFVSEFIRVPALDLAIVVLINNSSVDATRLSEAAFGIALGDEIEPLPKETSVALDASVPGRITGTYRLSEDAAKRLEERKVPKRALLAMRSVRVFQEGNTLYFKPSGQAAVAMVATGRSSFVLVGGKAKIEVPLDPGDAPATRLLLEQGPLEVEFTRRARQRGKPETSEEDAEASDGAPED